MNTFEIENSENFLINNLQIINNTNSYNVDCTLQMQYNNNFTFNNSVINGNTAYNVGGVYFS